MQPKPSPNFSYLAYHDARLVALATQAEELFAIDPPTSIAKLRLFAEILAKRAAARTSLLPAPNEPQQSLIERLFERNVIGSTQRALFHDLRRAGNAAVHENRGDASEALHQLRMARELAVWFQRTFGNNRKFDPGPFVPPTAPKKVEAASPALVAELTRLRGELAARAKEAEEARAQIEAIRLAAEKEASARLSAEEREAKAREEAAIWEALASEQMVATQRAAATAARTRELEEQNRKLLDELAALQAAAEAAPAPSIRATIERAAEASEAIVLDEAATRKLIDHQLRAAGWEADSVNLTFERGARPTRGKNLAIAEWPTKLDGKEGRADYVLFAGLQVLAVVEAKRKHTDVSAVVQQAKRYARGYRIMGDEAPPPGGPWCRDPDKGEPGLHVPFLFATNGRPYLRQLRTKSGIWFLDARRPANHAVPLEGGTRPRASSISSSRTSTPRTRGSRGSPCRTSTASTSGAPSSRWRRRSRRAGASCSSRWRPARARPARASASPTGC